MHVGHVDHEKIKSLTRLACWWPLTNSDITNYVQDSANCRKKKKNVAMDWQAWPVTYKRMQ